MNIFYKILLRIAALLHLLRPSSVEKRRGSRPLSLFALIARKNQTQIYSLRLMQTIVNTVEVHQMPIASRPYAVFAIAMLAKGKPNRIPIAKAGGHRVVCNTMKAYEAANVSNGTNGTGQYGMEALAYISEAEDNVAAVLEVGCPHADLEAVPSIRFRKFRG